MTYQALQLDSRILLCSDAKIYGAEASIILYHIKYTIERNQNNQEYFRENMYWCTTSALALLWQFPFFNNCDKIHRLLKKLIDKDAIIVGKFNKDKSLQTKWYALKPAETLNLQNCNMHVADLQHGKTAKTEEQKANSNEKSAEKLNMQNCNMQPADLQDAYCRSASSLNITIKESLRVESRDLDLDFIGNKIVDAFNLFADRYEKIKPCQFNLDSEISELIENLLKTYTADQIIRAIGNIENSSFLKGQVKNSDGSAFSLNIKYILKPARFKKLFENETADKGTVKKASKFEVETNIYTDESYDWDTALGQIKARKSSRTIAVFDRVDQYLINSAEAKYIGSKGLISKLTVVLFNFFFPSNTHLSDFEFDKTLPKKFPKLYKSPQNSKKAVLNA
ncbi:MAG: hypothetical protein HRU28_05515 [Rhizobiales bacterium]|nr:hypothetical protein [Hyphomicrobiales bacterium]